MNKITQREFDARLVEILNDMRASQLLCVSGIYEIVAEEYNNAIIADWDKERYLEDKEDDE